MVHPTGQRTPAVKSVARCFLQKDKGGGYIQGDTNPALPLGVGQESNLDFMAHKANMKLFIVSILCVLLLWVQNTYSCSWQSELLDEITREIKYHRVDETSLKIHLLKPEKGINVQCWLQKGLNNFGMVNLQGINIEISCLYADGQIIVARVVYL